MMRKSLVTEVAVGPLTVFTQFTSRALTG